MSASGLKNGKPDIRHWWLLPVSGVVLIAMGSWIFTEQLSAYLSISLLFAVGITGTGFIELMFVISTRRASGVVRWALLGAFVDLFIGIYLWFYPLISLIIVPVILGSWLMLRGVLAIASAGTCVTTAGKTGPRLSICGLLVLVTGIVLLTNMIWGNEDIILHTGVGFVIAGLFRVYLGFRLRNFKTPAHGQ
ncbi:hypothetical protein HK413_03190 [Mucilaginibacter sp. S1162]|uniref:HdeD family acid-resistance protein n=1 Tax=Mucilaginibacter humi TaxID=2732510 RepID=A0ABX1VZN0_9SPHI|nr:DUF308 domain-containing protein [Mucilaginibacter humi]NNU33407.1 hypothetical protein [Mucilaginibacter humi]